MTIDKEQLKALAEASQEWSEEIGESAWYVAGNFEKPFFGGPDAQFIAAANPATILALLDEIERHEKNGDALMYKAGMENVAKQRDQLKAVNFDLEALNQAAKSEVARVKAENEALRSQVAKLQSEPNSYQSGFDAGRAAEKAHAENWRAEAEGLRKDAERWRFVRNPLAAASPFAIWNERTNLFLGKYADEAIDAAMAKEAGRD